MLPIPNNGSVLFIHKTERKAILRYLEETIGDPELARDTLAAATVFKGYFHADCPGYIGEYFILVHPGGLESHEFLAWDNSTRERENLVRIRNVHERALEERDHIRDHLEQVQAGSTLS